MTEHQTGIQRSVPAGGGLSQSVARAEEIGLRGFPDVADADVLLAVIETSIFPQHIGGLPGGPDMAHRARSPVRVSKGNADVVHIHHGRLSACWKTQTSPSLHGRSLLSVFLKEFLLRSCFDSGQTARLDAPFILREKD